MDKGGVVELAQNIELTKPINITKDVTIKGNALTLASNMTERHILVNSGAKLTLTNIELKGHGTDAKGGGISTDGNVVLGENAVIKDNAATTGGGVDATQGTITIDGATIENNKAVNGGGIAASSINFTKGLIENNTAKETSFEAAKDEGKGGGIYALNNATVSDNAVIRGNKAAWGGGVHAKNVAINGGTIDSNKAIYVYPGSSVSIALGSGGGVYATYYATMTGGTVQNNVVGSTTETNKAVGGAGITIIDGATFVMTGGAITDNDYSSNANGGGIYAGNSSNTIIGGSAVVSNNVAVGSYIYGGGIYAGADSDVTVKENAKVSDNAAFLGGGIYSTKGSTINIADNALVSENAAASGAAIYSYSTINIKGGKISKNHDREKENTGAIGPVYGSTVNMSGGEISDNYFKKGSITAVRAENFNMSGGIIQNNISYEGQINEILRIGAVYTYNFTMSGGTIKDNKILYEDETSFGGGVFVKPLNNTNGEVVVNMTGGNISGNNAMYGGGIMVYYERGENSSNNITKISGGTIEGNKASSAGGLYLNDLDNKNKALIENATFKDNISGSHSGAIYAYQGDLDITNKAVFEGNRAETHSGAIRAYNSDVNIANGVVFKDNKAKGSAAGALYASNGNVTISNDVVFKNNETKTYAGALYVVNGKLDINNGVIFDNNKSTTMGGAVVISGADLNIDGSNKAVKFTNNTAGTDAGAIWGGLNKIVAKDVWFENNTAAEGYFLNAEEAAEDAELYNQNVKALNLSNPFTKYAYNNYDILYKKGELAEVYTVTFDSLGGSAVNPVKTAKNALVNKPADPTYDEYDFDGWYKDTGYTEAWDFANDKVVEDITLYAKWVDAEDGNPVTPNPIDPDPKPDPEIDVPEEETPGGPVDPADPEVPEIEVPEEETPGGPVVPTDPANPEEIEVLGKETPKGAVADKDKDKDKDETIVVADDAKVAGTGN